MKETVLKTNSLTKIYAKTAAVDHVNIHVNKGDIYGFIGQNGAGKTTFIRLITNLIFPTSGEIELFPNSNQSANEVAHKRIGSIIETPAFYADLTAHQNLEYYRIQRGIPDKACVEKCLQKVNLTNVEKKKFKDFSLGMKQRLGLALAIMNNPDFLILDEPTNGLDPMGIIEFRSIIQSLNQEHGMTIFISSHILTELAQTANTFGIIHQGKLVKEFTKAELEAETKTAISVVVDNPSLAVTVLEKELGITEYEVLPNNELRIYTHLDDPSEITYQLNTHNVRVASALVTGNSLEDYFLKTIGYTTGGNA